MICFLVILFLALGHVQNVWIGNHTRIKDESFLEPIVVHNASIGEMYTSFVNHTTEYLFDFEYSEREVISFIKYRS